MAKTPGTPQSSNKAGLRSLGKKMDNSRHGFDPQPAARKAEGAFGAERGLGTTAVRKRRPGTATPKSGKASALRRVR
jgi:hypothetical protein